ncbi:MAG: glycosyltransferase [Candidatus Hydrogenedentes bacterium]|nr:glycosyltransferase [Candidatus Hydrogenedentota bacterium]
MPSTKKAEKPRARRPAATKSKKPASAKKKASPTAKGKKPAAGRVKSLDVPKTGKPPAAKRTVRAKVNPKPPKYAARATSDGHFVSVVMPTIGRPSLEPSKAAVARQTRPPDELVVVVDHDRRGPAWALNEGIRRAKGDLIAFSPDDGEPEEKWLESLVSASSRATSATLRGDSRHQGVRGERGLDYLQAVLAR